ncbi:MAG: 4Fe-4S binding protein [Desulfamplus sp.]|nr:4Fe-4S binding protein [Desulfamplus sp.]
MKVKRKIIQIDEELCNGCGNCVISCAEGAIEIIDGKAKVVKDKYCDGLGACLGECPEDALKIIEREADEFDEKAVEERLKELEKNRKQTEEKTASNMACGCPSAHIQTFPVDRGHNHHNKGAHSHTSSNGHKPSHSHSTGSACACSDANKPANLKDGISALSRSTSGNLVSGSSSQSALGHWPVKIRLVPPTAPFLKGADLLVTADCTPLAYPGFHQDFLKGKVVMMGCPKFDDIDSYVNKFADIFKTAGIKTVTTLIMEVPCCSGLPMILQKAMALAGVNVPMTNVVISARGEILEKA